MPPQPSIWRITRWAVWPAAVLAAALAHVVLWPALSLPSAVSQPLEPTLLAPAVSDQPDSAPTPPPPAPDWNLSFPSQPSVPLPLPDTPPPVQPPHLLDALIPPPPTSALALPGPEPWDDPFTLEVLLLRRRGLDLTLIIQDTPANRAAVPAILLALDQVRAVFPRLRLACIVYEPSNLNTLDFGAQPNTVAAALDAPAPAPSPAPATSGLAAAVERAAGLAWAPKATSLVLVLATEAPLVAEIPSVWDSARDLASRHGARLAWVSLALTPGAEPPGEAKRQTAASSVRFLPLESPDRLGAELLRLALGDGRQKDIERICRVTAGNARNP